MLSPNRRNMESTTSQNQRLFGQRIIKTDSSRSTRGIQNKAKSPTQPAAPAVNSAPPIPPFSPIQRQEFKTIYCNRSRKFKIIGDSRKIQLTSAEKLNKEIKQTFTTTYEIFKKFKSWIQQNPEIPTAGSDIWPAGLTFLRHEYPHLKASSTRTYFNNIMAAEANERGEDLPRTPMAKNIRRHLDNEMSAQKPDRAPVLSMQTIQNLLPNSLDKCLLTIACLICSRVENLCGFFVKEIRPAREHEFPWIKRRTVITLRWFKHKTVNLVGQRDSTFPLPLTLDLPELLGCLEALKTPLKAETVKRIEGALPMNRCLRRSGAQFWQREGAPLDWLCTITLHTTVKALMTYLSS